MQAFNLESRKKHARHELMDTVGRPTRTPKASKFRQQELPAFRPLLNPSKVIALYLVVCAFLISLGCLCLDASNNVTQIKYRYDEHSACMPSDLSTPGERSDYLKRLNETIECMVTVDIHQTTKPPIYVYYELEDYFQNHRRYVKSRSDYQLAGKSEKAVADCKPKDKLDTESGDSATEGSRDINPCGLTAWSYFNDTFQIRRDGEEKNILNDTGIAWNTDVDYKFANYNATNFNENGTERGGGTISGLVSEDEHFIVWMQVAALSSQFRKLYGRIDEALEKSTTLNITIENNYNTYGFGGRKSIVLSTTSWLGGHDDFLGVLQITIGAACFVVGICYSILHIQFPRKIGDERFLSWTR